MKKIFALILFSLLAGAAFAQSSAHCYGVGIYSIDSNEDRHYDTNLCEFDDGRANVTSYVAGNYTSTDYSAAEWAKSRPVLMAQWDKDVADQRARNEAVAKKIMIESQRNIAQIQADAQAGTYSERACKKEAKRLAETKHARIIVGPADVSFDVPEKTFHFTVAWKEYVCRAIMLD